MYRSVHRKEQKRVTGDDGSTPCAQTCFRLQKRGKGKRAQCLKKSIASFPVKIYESKVPGLKLFEVMLYQRLTWELKVGD